MSKRKRYGVRTVNLKNKIGFIWFETEDIRDRALIGISASVFRGTLKSAEKTER